MPGVTAGLNSVGLRAPDHKMTLELIRLFNGPIAGPSANRSNHVSPTTAQHVRDEFGDAVDLILDGGPCNVGIESTVLDLSTSRPTLLRPGGISRAQIESIIGPIDVRSVTTSASSPSKSPGQHPVHYAPRAAAFRVDASHLNRLPAGAAVIRVNAQPEAYAREFYATLRQLDSTDPPAIYIEMPPDHPAWTAVRRPDHPCNSTVESVAYRTSIISICRARECIAHLSCHRRQE